MVIGLQVRANKNLSMKKARWAEDRERYRKRNNGLASGLIPKIPVAAVQTVTLSRVNLWWSR